MGVPASAMPLSGMPKPGVNTKGTKETKVEMGGRVCDSPKTARSIWLELLKNNQLFGTSMPTLRSLRVHSGLGIPELHHFLTANSEGEPASLRLRPVCSYKTP
jgi:hypothetical protein